MTQNRKRKAFTIVELVIVIAVIAVLAAVLIPTFASIINRANQSADIQAVRQMNVALMAESVENPPEGIKDVINILDAAGYNAKEKLIPVSKGHSFYWYKTYNLIILVKDVDGSDDAELIFPVEDEAMVTAFNDLKSNWDAATNGDTQVLFDLKEGEEYLSVNTVTANVSNLSAIKTAIADALEDGKSNVVININSDITVSEALTIGENLTVTFNLNDKTLTIGSLNNSDVAAVAEEPSYPSISVSGTLNIIGGTNGGTILTRAGHDGETPLGLVVNSTGTLNLNNMTVTVGTGATHALYNDGGKVTATDCTFNEDEDEDAEINYRYYAPIYNKGGIINMMSVNISSSELCTSGCPKFVNNDYVYGKITIDENSRLTLTGDKYVAPCGDYNAYYYDFIYGFTDNDNGDVFEYLGNSIDTTGFFFELKAACEEGGTIDLEADFELNHLISVAQTTTINLCKNAKLTISPYYSDKGFKGSGILNITGNGEVILDASVENCFDFDNEGKVSIVGDGDTEDTVIDIEVDQNIFTELFTALDRGYEFENCTLTYSSSTIAVNNAGVISLKSDASIPYPGISIPGNSTVTIDLNGHKLATTSNTINVPNNSTLNIVNSKETTSQITSSGNTNIFDVQEGGNLNLGNVELVTTNSNAYFLSYIMENNNITATDVSIEGNATLNKSIVNGKITTTLTLASNLTLGNDLTVSGNNTLEIVFNNRSLNSGNYAIIVEDGGKLIVKAQTVKGTGSFTVKSEGTIEISNSSTINKAITVNKGTLTVSDSTVSAAITADNARKVTFTNVKFINGATLHQNFCAFLKGVMASNDSTMTNVTLHEGSTHYLTVTKGVGKKTDILLIDTFTLSQPLTIPAGCDVTIKLNNKELKVNTTLEVFGKLTIAKDPDPINGGGGNLSCTTGSIKVCAGGELVLNANQYTAGSYGNTVQDVSVFVNSDYVKVQDGYNKKVTKNEDGSAIVTAVAPTT